MSCNQSPLPFSPSAERNRGPILEALVDVFAGTRRVLELGSGTGQHATHFAAALPQLIWQASEMAPNLSGLEARLRAAALANTPPPLLWDVDQAVWPEGPFDALFSANTLHIMGWRQVEALFQGLPQLLAPHAAVVIYGPFNVGGQHTSQGNAAFDAQLRASHPDMGLREVEAVDALARNAGLHLVEQRSMPANNLLLLWQRGEA